MNGGELTSTGADQSVVGRTPITEAAESGAALAGQGARWLLERYGVPAELVSADAKAAWREQAGFARSVLIRAYAAVWERDNG